MKAAATVVLLAILGIFIREGFAAETRIPVQEPSQSGLESGPRNAQRIASLPPATAFLAVPSPLLRPAWTPAAGTAADRAFECVVPPRTPSTIEGQGILIAAQVLEKYRSFRDSLSSP
jgi:hypothetical protein